jgi:hypothetical protein
MIPCDACGNQNPLNTRFCRQCGERLVINQDVVAQALQDDFAEGRSLRWMARGSSAVSVGGFLLVCALVLRLVVVPPLPLADVPPVDAGSVMPEVLPVAETAKGAPPAAKAKPPAPVDVPAAKPAKP